MINDAVILITGGTGSFGKAFVRMTLEEYNPKKLIIFSRDEMKQWDMRNDLDDDRIRYFIGDVRDKSRLETAFKGVDIVIHAAATKIVESAEYNPFECIKTNVNGAMNVIDVSIKCGVKKVIALSTDKACSPTNLYGASKLASDKLFIAGNSSYARAESTRFSVVRYGNVLGSRGSVVPFFLKQAKTGRLPITDTRMTRFLITLDSAVRLVWFALVDMVGGETYVKKLPSVRLLDIARAAAPLATHDIIGMRPGEKLHELMISEDDTVSTFEYDDYYKILPQLYDWAADPRRINGGSKVEDGFVYRSDLNSDWLSIREIENWIGEYARHEVVFAGR